MFELFVIFYVTFYVTLYVVKEKTGIAPIIHFTLSATVPRKKLIGEDEILQNRYV